MAPNVVAVRTMVGAEYPQHPPFHPSVDYPEYAFGACSASSNNTYSGVRACLAQAGLDATHVGLSCWNPFRNLISPGETVLLKPNFVKEAHPRYETGWRCVLTHGSVIRAVSDYVWKALDGRGRIVVGDAPQSDSSFSGVSSILGLDVIAEFYRSQGLDFQVIDFRREEWSNIGGVASERRSLPGDPSGYVPVDLGHHSEFADHCGGGRYYGADYDSSVVNRHHTEGRHEYLISGSAIECDVMFSLPKLKTHKKAGITVSLKNLVGINGDKNWLPHHTEGDPRVGGDERPCADAKQRLERASVGWLRQLSLRFPGLGPMIHRCARRVGRKVFGDTEDVIRSGNWWGNDTTWRMCLDLNKILLYANSDGTMRPGVPENRKRHYVLVDAIMAGEGRGPMNPDPMPAGMVLFGTNPASVDAACAVLMGFDPDRIPIVRQAFRCRHYPLVDWDWQDVELRGNEPAWNGRLADIPDESTLHFKPHFAWAGHIERTSKAEHATEDGSRSSLSPAADRAAEPQL
jgi:uncharacterized protein (DUF362 family)